MVVTLLPHHHLRSIPQRLRQMRGLDFLTARQICNRARQFQDAMIRSCRQIHLTHRRPHQTLTFVLQLAKLPYLPDTHVGIADDV